MSATARFDLTMDAAEKDLVAAWRCHFYQD